MEEFIGKKVLVTCSDWFYGEDGRQYKAIHGTLKGVHEAKEKLGFIPNRAHANWFYEIGNMVVMGCQVMYIQQVDEVNLKHVEEYLAEGGQYLSSKRPTNIYSTS